MFYDLPADQQAAQVDAVQEEAMRLYAAAQATETAVRLSKVRDQLVWEEATGPARSKRATERDERARRDEVVEKAQNPTKRAYVEAEQELAAENEFFRGVDRERRDDFADHRADLMRALAEMHGGHRAPTKHDWVEAQQAYVELVAGNGPTLTERAKRMHVTKELHERRTGLPPLSEQAEQLVIEAGVRLAPEPEKELVQEAIQEQARETFPHESTLDLAAPTPLHDVYEPGMVARWIEARNKSIDRSPKEYGKDVWQRFKSTWRDSKSSVLGFRYFATLVLRPTLEVFNLAGYAGGKLAKRIWHKLR